MGRGRRMATALVAWAALLSGLVVGGESPAGMESARTFRSDGGEPKAFSSVLRDDFVPTASRFALRGKMRHFGVEGQAAVEMICAFPDGKRYFSRHFVAGDAADWRDFALPFDLGDARPASLGIELSVVLPGKGVVELSALSLAEEAATGREGQAAWFTEREAGRWGGWLGGLVGVYGGLCGTVGGLMIPRGRWRRGVAGMVAVGAAAGGR